MTGPFEPSYGTSAATSLSMLERMRANDDAAWQRLVQLYGPVLRRWCLAAGLQASDADDVTQELFATIVQKLADFRREQPSDSFRGWLRVITRNRIRDHFRRLQKQPQAQGGSTATERLSELSAEPPDDIDEGTAELYRRALEMIQDEFEPATWTAFWQLHIEGRTVAEIVAVTGLTANAVYKARARVLKRLRTEFRGLLD